MKYASKIKQIRDILHIENLDVELFCPKLFCSKFSEPVSEEFFLRSLRNLNLFLYLDFSGRFLILEKLVPNWSLLGTLFLWDHT